MMMFDDKGGGWGWLNDDVSKKYTRKKTFFAFLKKHTRTGSSHFLSPNRQGYSYVRNHVGISSPIVLVTIPSCPLPR